MGYHALGCMKGGHRIAAHNAGVQAIAGYYKKAGSTVEIEKMCFTAVRPGSRRRADFTARCGRFMTFADFTICTPVPKVLRDRMPQKPREAAGAAEARKVREYASLIEGFEQDAATAQIEGRPKCSFTPFAMEALGGMGTAMLASLRRVFGAYARSVDITPAVAIPVAFSDVHFKVVRGVLRAAAACLPERTPIAEPEDQLVDLSHEDPQRMAEDNFEHETPESMDSLVQQGLLIQRALVSEALPDRATIYFTIKTRI